MEFLEKLQLLRKEILEVFPKISPPSTDCITTDTLGDSILIQQSLGGVNWWKYTSHLIDENHDKLPLLTSAAFHYYLPAFLLHSLEFFDSDSRTLCFTLYSLSPTKTPSDDTWYVDRVNQFTNDEINLIQKFLRFIIDDPEMFLLHKDAERGLKKFWHQHIK